MTLSANFFDNIHRNAAALNIESLADAYDQWREPLAQHIADAVPNIQHTEAREEMVILEAYLRHVTAMHHIDTTRATIQACFIDALYIPYLSTEDFQLVTGLAKSLNRFEATVKSAVPSLKEVH